MTGVVTAGVCRRPRRPSAGKAGAERGPARRRRRAAQCFLGLEPLQQRNEQAGGECVACGRAVDRVDGRWLGTGDLLFVLEQDRPLGAESDRDKAVPPAEHLELVAVDDGEVGVDVDRTSRRRVEAEESF